MRFYFNLILFILFLFLFKSLQRLKVIRHPSIVKYLESEFSGAELKIVTEPVQPLSEVLSKLSLDEVIAGLFRVYKALLFLHNQCNISHNHLNINSLYVSTIDGGWRLGGLDFAMPFKDCTKSHFESTRTYREEECILPEEREVG